MLTRRRLLQTSAGALLVPVLLPAVARQQDLLDWRSFSARLQELADGHASAAEIADRGTRLLRQLDTGSPDLAAAIDESWESGNRFWLWQRFEKQPGLLGGVLTIEQGSDVPLHDHPAATGMLRILSGTAELWQFDPGPEFPDTPTDDPVTLRLVTHRILRPGDTATLTPGSGNIHALRSISKECRMLDFFIPPYDRTRRNWYMPLQHGWETTRQIICRKISEDRFYTS